MVLWIYVPNCGTDATQVSGDERGRGRGGAAGPRLPAPAGPGHHHRRGRPLPIERYWPDAQRLSASAPGRGQAGRLAEYPAAEPAGRAERPDDLRVALPAAVDLWLDHSQPVRLGGGPVLAARVRQPRLRHR